ncbi:hypothetical protein FQN55_007330 [Onygenales sp. PD_40]|nr:hypothetical protein FQN55_007330 [Onygenales sp. PD_40]
MSNHPLPPSILLSQTPLKLLTALTLLLALLVLHSIYTNLLASPLRRVPGPKSYALTKWRLAYDDYIGERTRAIEALHNKYGDVVRVGPNEVSFRSLAALKRIYGAGSGFQRGAFYRMFDVYGRQNLFTFAGMREHGARKKLLNHAYSKTSILSPRNTTMVQEKTAQFLSLIASEATRTNNGPLEIFSALHYFSLDSISKFVYGPASGGGATACLTGSAKDRTLLDAIFNPARRRLTWFSVHLPSLTNWLYTRAGVMGRLITSLHLLPMSRPSTFEGIRAHGLAAVQGLEKPSSSSSSSAAEQPEESIMNKLWSVHDNAAKGVSLDLLDVASECADHLLAGIDTTSDTPMMAIFSLSQAKNRAFQEKLRAEVLGVDEEGDVDGDGVVRAVAADRLPYLDAVLKETLRLFAPLPGSEPRFSDREEVIDGFVIPGGTVVSMSPYGLHRNPEVFRDPLRFDPERWLGAAEEVAAMKKWFWAFSSGGRMCIGMHLAMAEMTTLLATVYRKYRTEIAPGFEEYSPGITARYEVFYDELFSKVAEHKCLVKFVEAQ